MKQHYFNLYILEQSTTRKQVPTDSLVWKKTVLSTSRSCALIKCQDEIKKFMESALSPDDNINIVSVYVGQKGSVTGAANRLQPIQLSLT